MRMKRFDIYHGRLICFIRSAIFGNGKNATLATKNEEEQDSQVGIDNCPVPRQNVRTLILSADQAR